MIKQLILTGLLGLLIGSAGSATMTAYYTPTDKNGIDIISNPDGKYKTAAIEGRDAVVSIDDTHYMYFRVEPEFRPKAGTDVWLVVNFFDDMPGQIDAEYTSTVKNYYQVSGIQMSMTKKWDRIIIPLEITDFKGIQNGGSDIRFTFSGVLKISRIELHTTKPDIEAASNEERTARLTKSILQLPQNGKPKKGMRYVYGDNSLEVTAPHRRYEIPFGGNRNDATIKLYKSLGATSVETYVTWETCEKDGYGKWDWRLWDKQFEVLKANDMKWTPFLIVGPAYSIPNWFRETKDHFPCRCLECGIDSKIESLWNPNLKKWITRFLSKFAERYDKDEILESVLVGIQGDYGEAIYSVFGGWTQQIPGDYHAHQGFWCNDPYALADYRSYIEKRYPSINELNAAWGTSYSGFDSIDFPGYGDTLTVFRKKIASGDPLAARQWLDFVTWYRAAMTDLSDWWLAETKRIFPNTRVYLCTGGNGAPEHGSDFSEQCRIAAKNGCGVRITNEGPGYQWNNVLTRLVASSGRHFGASFGFEPASNIDINTIPGRIYNATISGSDHLHDYSRNIISSEERMDVQRKAFKYLEKTKPVVPIALWYPNVAMTLDNAAEFGKFSNGSAKLREYADHDYIDEIMLRNNALKRYKILVINNGGVMETSDAELISKWIKRGGMLIAMGSDEFVSVEGTNEPEKILFRGDSVSGKYGKGSAKRVADLLEMSKLLSEGMAEFGYPVIDMKEDGLYASQISKSELLYLNTTTKTVNTTVSIDGEITRYSIPPSGITKINLND